MRTVLVVAGLCMLSAAVGYAQHGEDHAGEVAPHPTLPHCDQDDPDLLLPDLRADDPSDTRLTVSGGRRLLRFTTAVGNVGDGPLILEGRTISVPEGVYTQGYQIIWKRDGSQCARATGRFDYHSTHKHFHFDDFVGYELRTGDPNTGALAATGSKASFCLLDLEWIRGFPQVRQVHNQTCNTADGIQGISVGWKDVYERTLPGQWIELDVDADNQVPAGGYYLVNRVDPDDLIWETNKDNNLAFTVVGVSMGPPRIDFSTPAPTPAYRPPNIRPGRERPARPTRVPRVRPTPAPRVRPTRTARPPRGTQVTPIPTPVPATPRPTPRPTFGGGPPPSPMASCENACPRSVSQIRFFWYSRVGLSFSANVSAGNCGQIKPQAGDTGVVQMTNFLTEARRDTGIENSVTLDMADESTGSTSDGGTVGFVPSATGSTKVTYTAPLEAPADMSDGMQFPVVFDMCVAVGDQAVKMRLVCQPKPSGMLCHEG